MNGWSSQNRDGKPADNAPESGGAGTAAPPNSALSPSPELLEVPEPAEAGSSAGAGFSTRTKILTVLGGLLVLGLVLGLAYCQSGTPPNSRVAAAKTGPTAAATLTAQQSTQLAQPTPGPGLATATATPGLGLAPGLGSSNPALLDPSIFPAAGATPEANQPVTQPRASPAGNTANNGLSGTVAGPPEKTETGASGGRSGDGPASATSVATTANARPSASGGRFGGGSGNASSSPPPPLPDSAPAGQSSYYFFTPAATAPVRPAAPPAVEARPVNPAVTPSPVFLPVSAGPAPAAPVRPPFGTVLPLQTLGALDSLRANALARLVLTREVRGAGYVLPRGTVFVARVSGSQADRLYLQVLGYLDASRNRVLRLSGEMAGTDGAGGLRGARQTVGSKWRRVLQYLAERGPQSFNTWLAGRSGGNSTSIQLPSTGELGVAQNTRQAVSYVRLAPGAFGYFTVTDLPPEQAAELAPPPPQDDAPGPLGANAAGLPASQNYISSAEIVQLLSSGTPAQIRAALPRMPPDVRQIVAADLARQP